MWPRPVLSRIPFVVRHLSVGVLLALLQLLLYWLGFSHFGTDLNDLGLNWSFLPGLALYLLLPAGVICLQTVRRQKDPGAGAQAGCMMGLGSGFIVLFALLLALVLFPPQISPGSRIAFPIGPIIALLLFWVGVLAGVGVLLAMLGGALGKALGGIWVKRARS